MNYTLGDFLIRLKNAYMANRRSMNYPFSKAVFAIGKILEEEGYAKKVKDEEIEGRRKVVIDLLYKSRMPAIHDVKLISKPSAHVYARKGIVRKSNVNFGITVVSTSKGVMSGRKALKAGLGGELICKIS